MSANIETYIGNDNEVKTKIQQTIYLVQGYANKTYEDKTGNCKNALEKAKKHRNERLAYYENRPKEYRAIKRYGDVLEKVERLLGIVPSPKKEFSLEDLSEKMKKFAEARKNMQEQTSISYFQDVLTSVVTNMLKIEKEYTNENDALAKLASLDQELKENKSAIPNELHYLLDKPFEEAEQMLSSYSECVLNTPLKSEMENNMGLVDASLSKEQISLNAILNNRANRLLGNIASLDSRLKTFEPQVDLNGLAEKIEKADGVMESMVFDPDNLDSVVTDIENTTDSLTTEQNYRNQESADLSSEIETITNQTETLTKESLQRTAFEIIQNANVRHKAAGENTDYIQKLAENGQVSEEFLKEVTDTMQAQSTTDHALSDKMVRAETGVDVAPVATLAKKTEKDIENTQALIEQKIEERRPDYRDYDEEEE